MPTDAFHRAASALRLRSLRPLVARVREWEPQVKSLSNADLRESAALFRNRMARGEALDDLLPEVCARVREAAGRCLGERHFDVQVLGALALHRGWIVEMQTGEGKTLTATMPAFVNALSGRGVHVVTVNDYLAARDAAWMEPVYKALGLTVAHLAQDVAGADRAAAYRADVTYGANKEFAFDYLRDQIARHTARAAAGEGVFEQFRRQSTARAACVQREPHYAILDEVDSILIDEARVPLIISERDSAESRFAGVYRIAREVALGLQRGRDYTLDLPEHRVELTLAGTDRARAAAPAIPMPPNRPFEHLVHQALRAELLFLRDREYLLTDGKVGIVDEFTGRILKDRTWSLGLHQAVEAKEGVPITEENRTLASVTFQRYFKGYRKLAGMTGTALVAAAEFARVFDLTTVSIPTNRPLRRRYQPTRLFATWEEKYAAIAARVLELHKVGRPVLVGTRSVGRSEALSALLTARGIDHNVLNARNHAIEALVIAQAGARGRVTIATNMAGRGVDIKLEPGVAGLGGLHVLATELHEARRIDRQLTGRCARQGDPGSCEFYLSFEDEILQRWNKKFALWLAARAPRRAAPSRLWLPVFHIAQRSIERRHLRIRLDLIRYDQHLEEMKGTLGAPQWG
jgi:preprotein translocase subunit SecA